MAVAAPRRATAAAPAPSRTAPPEPKKRPRDRPKPGGPARKGSAAAPARTAPARKPARKAPARKAPSRRKAASARAAAAPAPTRRTKSAARTAPARAPRRKSPGRRAAQGGQLIPIAVGRTAATVRALPDSGPIVRLTRGRSWIAVLGVLLVGIVALNVVTLSFAASAGKIDQKSTTLEKENSGLGGRTAAKYSQERIRQEAAKQGLKMSTTQSPVLVMIHKGDVATAAARLAAATSE